LLGYGVSPLFIGTLSFLQGTTYLWNVRVVMYEKLTTNRIYRTHQVIEAAALRMLFEAGIHDATRQVLVVLCHEEDDQMEHSQYHHFPSQAREGADAVVLPTGDRDHVGCLSDQVRLTRVLNEELDQAAKEICHFW
jgi:hypothetical protein